MPFRSSSPKAVRRAAKALAAAILGAAAVAGPATAHAMVPPPGAYLPGAHVLAEHGPSAASKSAAATGTSDAAQRTRDEADAPFRTSYQPVHPTGFGAHMTPMTISSQTAAPSRHITPDMVPAKDLGITLTAPHVSAASTAGVGFDVSSAAIGAGGALVLAAALLCGALAITPKRRLVRQA